ncbi:MAG: mechanosensitive ion channel [Taibaiella sp.]|nr:mechanosensitive ion channel [Taibaiella sp.]
MNELWDKVYFGNTILSWVTAGAILVAGVIAIMIFNRRVVGVLRKWASRTESNYDDILVANMERAAKPVLLLVTCYLAFKILNVPPMVDKGVHIVILIGVTYFVLRISTFVVKSFIYSFISKQENSEAKEKQVKGLLIILNAVIWIIGVLFLLNNLGYNVSTIVAGLGIGGIAIALAAQTILGDLFSYFVIFFDKPFEIGDFIVVDDKSGTVEYIGIKTTRLRSLGGEQLICSNTFLTNAKLHNYKRMQRRRIVFGIGVIYDTPLDQLKQIPGWVRDIIQSTEQVTFDRGHFTEFGSSSLNFEFVYYVESSDFNNYRDIHQSIGFRIAELFQRQGLEFAFPTQTLYVQRVDGGKDEDEKGS